MKVVLSSGDLGAYLHHSSPAASTSTNHQHHHHHPVRHAASTVFMMRALIALAMTVGFTKLVLFLVSTVANAIYSIMVSYQGSKLFPLARGRHH